MNIGQKQDRLEVGELIQELSRIAIGDVSPFHWGFGLCHAIRNGLSSKDTYQTVQSFMQDWPEYSGAEAYPVRHPWRSPAEAYNECSNKEFYHGEYGEARRRLAGYLVYRLTNYLYGEN